MVKPEHREDCQCPGTGGVLVAELLGDCDGPYPDPLGDLPTPDVRSGMARVADGLRAGLDAEAAPEGAADPFSRSC